MHTPADNQVIVSPVPAEDQATTAVLFLVRQGQPDARLHRQLRGRRRPPTPTRCACSRSCRSATTTGCSSSSIATTLQIRSLTAADKQGGRSTFQFSNFKENVGLADKAFEFKIPRGADVIQAGSTVALIAPRARPCVRWSACGAAAGAAAPRARRSAPASRPSTRRTSTAPSSSTPTPSARTRTIATRAARAPARAAAGLAGALSSRGRRLAGRRTATKRRSSSTSSPPS